jgi:hypothetical protein
VTDQTVKFHLANVYRKLGVRSRFDAARWAFEHGVLETADEALARAGADENGNGHVNGNGNGNSNGNGHRNGNGRRNGSVSTSVIRVGARARLEGTSR